MGWVHCDACSFQRDKRPGLWRTGPELASIEEYLGARTPAYYGTLQDAQGGRYQPERDASGWIAFCVEAHLSQARERLAQIEEAAARWTFLEEIVDKAGDFLISVGAYGDGLELYRAAVARFPNASVFHQGVGCCAGHEGLHAEALLAAEAALALEPDKQELVNDLGWSLHLVDRVEDAVAALERAIAMDPGDRLAAENLRVCAQALADHAA